jgi:translation initiation factor IF-3
VKERKKINEELHYIPELLLIDQDKKVIGKKTYHEAISLARMNKLELVLVQVSITSSSSLV